MPSMMKILMDEFYEKHSTAIKEKQYDRAIIFSFAEDFANRCHQMTNEEIHTFLTGCLTDNRDNHSESDAERQAWQECLDILNGKIKV